MMRWAIVASVLLQGCAMIGAKILSPADVAEATQLLEAQKANGCAWLRGRVNPPAGQVELDLIYAFGGNGYLECVKTLRP